MFSISESKVQRILKEFENEHQIEQQTSPRNRLISIVNWSEYQNNEHQSEQQVNNKRTTNEQQMNTNKNVKNEKNVKNVSSSLKRREEIRKKSEQVLKEINGNGSKR